MSSPFRAPVARATLALAAVLALLSAKIAFAQALADEIQLLSLAQQDLDGDGSPDLAVIDCAFATEHDRVLVYDRGDDMVPSTQWQQATDFDDDLWVFDAGADGQAELVLDFARSPDGVTAALWDDQNGDGTVRYGSWPGLEVLESEWPTVRVTAADGWWLRGYRANFNLRIDVDGPVRAAFQAPSYLRYLEVDGTADFELWIWDSDHDGNPEGHWINAWPEAPSGWGVHRTELMVNPEDDEPAIRGSIFWPYLGTALGEIPGPRGERPDRFTTQEFVTSQESYGFVKEYRKSFPPIQMAWHKGALAYVGEFVASRFNDSPWFVYSPTRVEKGRLSPVTFEAPFAFYDLAGDDDGYPELQIRFEHYLEHDPYLVRTDNPEPIQVVRYSWDQDNNRSWDYKLGLVGRHEITPTLRYDGLAMQTVPPRTLPGWILNRNWDGATFVAAEYEGYWTSEGIYNWGISPRWFTEYITGFADRPPTEEYQELPVRLRGEVSYDLHSRPMLYLSPVDRKLHLLGAQRGIWNIDDGRQIVYESLGGEYIDCWNLMEDGELVKTAYQTAGFLILADAHTIQFTRVELPSASLVIPPPSSHEEWADLGRRLESLGNDLSPDDFEGMIGQHGRPEIRIEGANLRDLRLTPDGFRFILKLQPGFRSTGDEGFDIEWRDPGIYLVTYDGVFHTTPLIPSHASLELDAWSKGSLVVGNELSVAARLGNPGMEDWLQATVQITADCSGETVEVFRQEVDVLAGHSTEIGTLWQPSQAGNCQIAASAKDSAGNLLEVDEEKPLRIEVLPKQGDFGFTAVSVDNTAQWLAWIMLVLISLSAATGVRVAFRAGNR